MQPLDWKDVQNPESRPTPKPFKTDTLWDRPDEASVPPHAVTIGELRWDGDAATPDERPQTVIAAAGQGYVKAGRVDRVLRALGIRQ